VTFTVNEVNDAVCLSGELSRMVATKALDSLLQPLKQKQTTYRLDLTDLVACDSAGVSVLLSLDRALQKKGCALFLAHPPLFLQDIIRVSGLDRVLRWA